MAANKYLAVDATTGLPKETAATDTSAGSTSAGALVALNSAGQIDSTMMPAGVGAVALSLPTTESIAAGALCNVYSNSGASSLRNASASDATKPADCFVNSAAASGATATAYGPGQLITGLSGLTPGQRQYLDTTAGGITSTPPSATGNLLQYIGTAVSVTSILFDPSPGIIRA